jgi:hypothetical protein
MGRGERRKVRKGALSRVFSQAADFGKREVAVDGVTRE